MPTPRSANFRFPWLLSKVVLEGLSILDVPRLKTTTMEEATNFIQAYGYDSSNVSDMELLWRHFDDAVVFIEQTLKDPDYPKVPEHLNAREAVKDFRRLILLASSSETHPDQIWSCAILRVMHVLIHLAHDPRLRYFEQAQKQVFSRLDDYLYVDSADGAIYLGKESEGGGIKLLFFKKKDRKDKDREIVKLLHKAETSVEIIYDRIGFRLVTETKFDAIRAVRFLLRKNIISVPNIRPYRSRNWLIDMSRLQTEMEKIHNQLLKAEAEGKEISIEKALQRLEKRIGIKRPGRSIINPHSSEHYRAIQFTCRELVRVTNPMYQTYEQLSTQLAKIHGASQVLSEVFPSEIPKYEYVFFPYEIQITDVKSYADSIFGKSNHEEYRRKQLDVARNRTFGRSPLKSSKKK